MTDGGAGCVYTIVIGLVLLALLAVGVGYVLEQWEGVQRAEAVVAQERTVQQKDYYAFMAAMAAMGRSVGAPWWVYALALFDVVLIAVLVLTRRGQ